MKYLESFFLVVGVIASIFLVAGLYQPWMMLWWREKQNRRMVIGLYGIVAILSFLIHISLRIL